MPGDFQMTKGIPEDRQKPFFLSASAIPEQKRPWVPPKLMIESETRRQYGAGKSSASYETDNGNNGPAS
jgi:hypothetical protein